ncbi:glycosyltransferase [Paraburkholderia sp. UCT31]|uniref:glycosyltransferase n=1 Tax=Paraburkholderia sp. UCT31 TaxID=2615209 RepID=UPI0016564252|nr:glycosyltransferase [Paraburkholderia sp. UCT31]
MKILQVTESYGAGVMNSVNQLAEGLRDRGHRVVLAVNPRAEAPKNWRELVPAGVPVHTLVLRRSLNPLRDSAGMLQLASLFVKEKPDVIHLHSSKAGFAGRVAARLTGYGARTFYSPRAFAHLTEGAGIKAQLYRHLEVAGARFGGVVVACSQDEYEEAQRLGVRATLINNAIDISGLSRFTAGVAKAASPLVRIVTAGRITEAKRPGLFVAVADELARRKLPFSMTWIGAGDPLPATPNATSTGWKTRAEVVQTLQSSADLYVQTSAYEGMPLAVLEAQALGLPAVVTDVIGNRSAVAHGKTGFVVASNVQAVADALQMLIERKVLYREMAVAARIRAEAEFDTPLMLSRYEALYRDFL